MTDNDIIKALGFCESPDCECTGECPMFHNGINSISDCRGELHKNALCLINRQKEEIERLRKANDYLGCQANACNPTQTIKDFAAYLCDGRVSNDPVVIAMKCAVKELTEEQE